MTGVKTEGGLAHEYACYGGSQKAQGEPTHWVNLRLTIHARSSAMETPSGARTVHGKENANLPTL